MADYPLIFTLIYDIRSKDFAARVVTTGRALMTFEDAEWWCHGVEPGGLTEHGADPVSAFVAFQTAYHDILQDTASDSGSFEAFSAAVERFVGDKDRTEADRWERARAQIRAGQMVEEPFNILERKTDDFKASTAVRRLQQIKAREVEEIALAQEAA